MNIPFRSSVLLAAMLVVAGLSTDATAQRGWNGPYGSIMDDPVIADRGARALRTLYDMNPLAADAVIDSLARDFPDHPITPFLQGLSIWWRILPDLATGDRSLDRAFFDQMDRTVRAADRVRRDPRYAFDAVFFKAAALGFRGRHLSNREEWLKAAKDGKDALDLVFELEERDPDNPDFLFGIGVYNYFASVIPEEYPIVKPFMLFFPDADRDEGLRQLEITAQDARFVGTEAAYFLLQIHFIYKPDYRESLRLARLLRERHPTNAFFHVLEGRVYTRWGQWQAADRIFHDILDAHAGGVDGYSDGLAQQALYYQARSRMVGRNLEGALESLGLLADLSEDDPSGSVYRVLGRLRSGMVLDALGRRTEAERAYRDVLEMRNVGDAHGRARRYLKEPYK